MSYLAEIELPNGMTFTKTQDLLHPEETLPIKGAMRFEIDGEPVNHWDFDGESEPGKIHMGFMFDKTITPSAAEKIKQRGIEGVTMVNTGKAPIKINGKEFHVGDSMPRIKI